jgi:pyridoxine/pyridoxamine 5'-phosphate oxidase
MASFSDLDALLDHVWATITGGAGNPERPFYTPTFVTRRRPLAEEDGHPNARTVVLRAADREARALLFHSDRRARKIDEIRADDRVAFHHWDAGAREQLRLKGRAAVHTSSEVAERLWADATPRQRMLYVKDTPPGTRVEAPRSGLPDAVEDADELAADDVAAGRAHFAAVRTVVSEITWLTLGEEGHARARFTWTGEAWEGAWVIP